MAECFVQSFDEKLESDFLIKLVQKVPVDDWGLDVFADARQVEHDFGELVVGEVERDGLDHKVDVGPEGVLEVIEAEYGDDFEQFAALFEQGGGGLKSLFAELDRFVKDLFGNRALGEELPLQAPLDFQQHRVVDLQHVFYFLVVLAVQAPPQFVETVQQKFFV